MNSLLLTGAFQIRELVLRSDQVFDRRKALSGFKKIGSIPDSLAILFLICKHLLQNNYRLRFKFKCKKALV